MRLLPILALLAAGCLPPVPVPPDGLDAERIGSATAQAATTHRKLRAEVWREAGQRARDGASEREVGEWLQRAEAAALKAADQPLAELTGDSLGGKWTPERAGEFFDAGANGFED